MFVEPADSSARALSSVGYWLQTLELGSLGKLTLPKKKTYSWSLWVRGWMACDFEYEVFLLQVWILQIILYMDLMSISCLTLQSKDKVCIVRKHKKAGSFQWGLKDLMKLPSEAQPVFHHKNLINISEWHFICFTMTFGIRMKELGKEI